MAEYDEGWTIRRLLEWTAPFFMRKGVDSPRLSAELLLSHVLRLPRIKLYTGYENVVGEEELAAYRELVKRAAEHEPIAYLTGTAHFFNLEFEVNRDVLIPRPESETLVEHVLQFVRNKAGLEGPRVLDLCTGSGCIAAAIAYHLKGSTVLATDKSGAAVAVARRNIRRLGLEGRVVVEEGDLFEAVEKQVDVAPFDLIVANPPYIRTEEIGKLDRNVREYEPRAALDGGPDGLAVHRRIMAEAGDRVVCGGRVFLEIAFDQGESARRVMSDAVGFEDVTVLKDYGGRDRVVSGRRCGRSVVS